MMNAPYPFRRWTAASLVLIAVAVSGCSDDDAPNDPGLPAATDYAGFVASTDGQTGPLSITFASPVSAPPAVNGAGTGPNPAGGAPVNATGTVSIGGGAAAAITGSIEGGTLTMSGGGWTLTGSLLNGMLVGTFTAPGGVTGSLSAVASASGSPAKTYCGYFEGSDLTADPPEAVYGTFSVVIAGDVVLGTAVSEGGNVIDFSGTATATAFTIATTTTEGTLNASGSYDGESTEGTYNVKVSGTTVQTGAFIGYPSCAPPQ
ncbi:MAG TPA: hypothetical protein VFV65_04905 [Gemmatimonadales bacterium]|nr:hypothetical protein [Gemmatimonadales bacterium]